MLTSRIVNDLSGFLDSRLELLKFEAKEKIAFVIAALLTISVFLFISLTALAFIGIACSIKLNIVFNSPFLGYLVVSALYFIIVLSLILFINKRALYNRLIKHITYLFDFHQNES